MTPSPPAPAPPPAAPLRVEDERDGARPAGEVLARIPWDGRRRDPESMSAARFLGTLRG